MILSNISFFCAEHISDEITDIVRTHWVNAVASCQGTSDIILSRLLTETQPGVMTLCLQWKSPSLAEAEAVESSFALTSLHEALRTDHGNDVLTFTSRMEII